MTIPSRILPNEKKLFARIAENDEEAFTIVFHHYNRRIYPFVLKMIKSEVMAEEIVQEVFMKLWSKRETLAEIKSPQSFIFTMATNRTLDYLKKLSNESRMIKEIGKAMGQLRNNEIEEWFDGKGSEYLIYEAINALPPQRQLVYKLSRQHGKSYKEIGQELNISPKTVQAHLVEAIRSIKEYLQKAPGGYLALVIYIFEMHSR